MTAESRSTISLSALCGVIVLLTAFPSGAFAWMPAVASLALGLAALATTPRRGSASDKGESRPFELPAAAILVFMLVSLIPLAPGLTWIFGPARHAQVARAAGAVREAESLGILGHGQPPLLFSLTHNRAGGLRLLVMAAGACSAAILASRLAPRERRIFLLCMTALGAVIGTAGLIVARQPARTFTLWWTFKVPIDLPGPMVCFCNRNHFAAFLAMIAPAALCLTLRGLRRNLWSFFPLLAMFLAVSAGVIFSCSRGGWAAYLCGMLACAAGLLAVRRAAPAVAVLLAGCVAAAFLLVGPAPQLKERLATLQDARETDSYRTRVQCWKDSARIWLSHPVVGAGPNGFRMVYPAHRTASRSSFMTHAENEYVQTAVDGGLVGIVLAFWLLAAVVGGVRTALRGDESRHIYAVSLVGALAAAAVSAGVDFALHIPLYAVTLAAFAGLAFTETDRSGGARSALLPALAIFAAVIGGTWSFRTEEIDDPRVIHGAGSSELARALVWAPTFQYAWHGLGRAAWATGTRPAVEFGERCMSAAVEYDPKNYVLWKELGLIRLGLGDTPGAREAFARVRKLRSWVPVPDLPEAAR